MLHLDFRYPTNTSIRKHFLVNLPMFPKASPDLNLHIYFTTRSDDNRAYIAEIGDKVYGKYLTYQSNFRVVHDIPVIPLLSESVLVTLGHP